MNECLPLGSLDASTPCMRLTQERSRRAELEQEVARLQAGLARQNETILGLERRAVTLCLILHHRFSAKVHQGCSAKMHHEFTAKVHHSNG
jgi:hypothetical protein